MLLVNKVVLVYSVTYQLVVRLATKSRASQYASLVRSKRFRNQTGLFHQQKVLPPPGLIGPDSLQL